LRRLFSYRRQLCAADAAVVAVFVDDRPVELNSRELPVIGVLDLISSCVWRDLVSYRWLLLRNNTVVVDDQDVGGGVDDERTPRHWLPD